MLYYSSGSTSNLLKHLKGGHITDPGNDDCSSKQRSITVFAEPRKSNPPTEKLTKFVTNMIVSDCLTLSFVNGKGFQELMDYITPGYVIPCANIITA